MGFQDDAFQQDAFQMAETGPGPDIQNARADAPVIKGGTSSAPPTIKAGG